MTRTQLRQEIRTITFENALTLWTEQRLTRAEAARLIGVCERIVGRDNCVSFGQLSLQISADPYRCNYVKTKIRVHRYPDQTLAIFHGPRKLAN